MSYYSEDFKRAMDIIFKWEGRVIHHDPDDSGGMTCCGIARNFHPNWRGWDLIDNDRLDDRSYQNEILADGTELSVAILEFYYDNFWNNWKLDNYPYEVSFEICDVSINCGPKRSGEFIQRAINALNYNNKDGDDLVVDGRVGPITLGRLQKCIDSGRAKQMAAAINCQQGEYYIRITENKSSHKKFFAGWMKRTYNLDI